MKAFLFAIIPLVLFAQSYTIKEEKEWIAKIENTVESKNDTAFVAACDTFLEQHKISAVAWFLCGKNLLFVKTKSVRESRANARIAYKRLEIAQKEFNKTSKQVYLTLDALQYMGLAAMFLNDDDRALTAFKTALARDNRLAAAWYNVAVIYERRGNQDEAMRAFDKYLRLKQNTTKDNF